MSDWQEFFHFDDLNSELQKFVDWWDQKRSGKKITFLSNLKYKKYISWKSVVMLSNYMTRFGNIKPRAYTGNSVSTQKKVRTAILRARELWFLEYTR
jgi:ribosomal protein S18